MCRYSDHKYRTHYICLPCRRHVKHQRQEEPAVCCTLCGAPMIHAGRDFAAPRAQDDDQWVKLAEMHAAGGLSGRFDSCGCGGHGGEHVFDTLGELRHPIMAGGTRQVAAGAAKRHDDWRQRAIPFPDR
jgi:DNA-directed RNA polymerase subunit RPC12/RpoP